MVQFCEERSHRRRFDVDRKKVFEAPIPLSSRQKEDEGESYDIVVGEREGVDKATQRNFWTCDEPTVVSSKVIRDPVAPRRTQMVFLYSPSNLSGASQEVGYHLTKRTLGFSPVTESFAENMSGQQGKGVNKQGKSSYDSDRPHFLRKSPRSKKRKKKQTSALVSSRSAVGAPFSFCGQKRRKKACSFPCPK